MRDDYIWMVSYPRAGSTWLRMMLAKIQFPDTEIGYTTMGEKLPDVHQRSVDVRDGEYLHSPVIVKSHFRFRHEYVGSKVIYLYRDVRDVVLSFYHFQQRRGKWDKDFNEFLKFFIKPNEKLWGGWDRHIKFWMFENHTIDALAIKYEDLASNTFEVVSIILSFIGMKVEKDLIREAIDGTSWDRMIRIAARDGFHPQLRGLQGRCGYWRDELNEGNKKDLWNAYGKILIQLGYSEE